MKKMRMLGCFLIVSMLMAVPVQAVAEVKIGIMPRRSATITQSAFDPLAKKLTNELGEKVELVQSKDFPTFWKNVQNNVYDVIHYSQYHYIKAHKELGHSLMVANEEFGKRELAGAIYVRRESGINKVTDLEGKMIFFGGSKQAMGAYIAPMAILKKNNLEPEKKFQYRIVKSGPGAVMALSLKQADAACAGNVVFDIEAATRKIDREKITILAESEKFVQIPWAAREDFPEEKKARIIAVMTSLKESEEGRAILEAAGVTDFFPVTDADYDSVRNMVSFVLGEQY